jgi:hypothetical protein
VLVALLFHGRFALWWVWHLLRYLMACETCLLLLSTFGTILHVLDTKKQVSHAIRYFFFNTKVCQTHERVGTDESEVTCVLLGSKASDEGVISRALVLMYPTLSQLNVSVCLN